MPLLPRGFRQGQLDVPHYCWTDVTGSFECYEPLGSKPGGTMEEGIIITSPGPGNLLKHISSLPHIRNRIEWIAGQASTNGFFYVFSPCAHLKKSVEVRIELNRPPEAELEQDGTTTVPVSNTSRPESWRPPVSDEHEWAPVIRDLYAVADFLDMLVPLLSSRKDWWRRNLPSSRGMRYHLVRELLWHEMWLATAVLSRYPDATELDFIREYFTHATVDLEIPHELFWRALSVFGEGDSGQEYQRITIADRSQDTVWIHRSRSDFVWPWRSQELVDKSDTTKAVQSRFLAQSRCRS